MDVNEILRMMRDALARVDALDGDAADRAREDACECARALDGWLSKGGFLPAAWERPFGVAHSRNRDRVSAAVSLTAEFDDMLARDVLRPPDD